MTDDIPHFLTPDTEHFIQKLPTGHPRLHVFLNEQAENAYKTVTSHPEYNSLVNRANRIVKRDFTDIADFYQTKNAAEELNSAMLQLYQAYYLTRRLVYADKMMEIVRKMLLRVPTDKELFSAPSNFVPTNIAQTYIFVYDLLFERLAPTERTVIENVLLAVARFYYNVHVGKRENELFDSHFWQYNMLVFFNAPICFMTKRLIVKKCCPCCATITKYGRLVLPVQVSIVMAYGITALLISILMWKRFTICLQYFHI